MCSCPIEIRNPYKGSDVQKGLNYLHDCQSDYIQVPCGHCRECISARQSSYSVRSSVELGHSVCFFITLTYDNIHVPRIPANGDCLDGFAYCDYSHLSRLFHRFRKHIERDEQFGKWFAPVEEFTIQHSERKVKLSPFKYLAVAEFGKEHLRPHYHILLFVRLPRYITDFPNYKVRSEFTSWCTTVEHLLHDWFRDNWAVNVGTRKNPRYELLYKYVRNGKYCTYDCHLVRSVDGLKDDSPIFYVTKYLYKHNEKFELFQKFVYAQFKQGKLSYDRWSLFYLYTHRLCRTSNYFGYPLSASEFQCIRHSIDISRIMKRSSPLYVLPDGSTSVFPQYYKQFLTLDDVTHFAYNLQVDSIPTLYECYLDYRDREKSQTEVDRIASRIKVYDGACDSLCDFVDALEQLRYNKGSCEATSPEQYDYDIRDDLKPDYDFYRHSAESSGEDQGFHYGFLDSSEQYEQLTLFDL